MCRYSRGVMACVTVRRFEESWLLYATEWSLAPKLIAHHVLSRKAIQERDLTSRRGLLNLP
jgi:hypothetical protein